MLQRLSIQNYAIIDTLDIELSPKLNVITGETGAGKSIIVGALNLILGQRADSTSLVNKEKKCVVEGVFRATKKTVAAFLSKHDIDPGEEIFLRREITTNGKSRGFINDTPVNLSQLQELSSLLVDLHQQFDTLTLNESDFQREVLDALAGQQDKMDSYRSMFMQWHLAKKEMEKLKAQKLRFDKEADYNKFQFEELASSGFRENELEEIDSELKLLNNSEEIKAALEKAYSHLHESETPVVQQLKIVYNQLNGFASFHSELPVLLERLQSAQIELQDIAAEIGQIYNNVNYDPKKITELNERLSTGYRLQKKHGVSSTKELLEIQAELEMKLQAELDIDESIVQKEKQMNDLFEEVTAMAATLSQARAKQIKSLEEKVNKLLARVGMPNAVLKVRQTPLSEPAEHGADDIEFLFDANLPAAKAGKGGQFLPVKKVASGGELSRLMLCIKSLVAKSMDLPTMIFDEIDTGISGEAARQVGMIMKELAMKRQVISITHQPQIAGKADAHFFVYKEIVNDKVVTNIRQLTTEERITAIAKMLGGEKPTTAALQNATEMIKN
jgi:DNA repair protein RecN (Recombination protein N)